MAYGYVRGKIREIIWGWEGWRHKEGRVGEGLQEDFSLYQEKGGRRCRGISQTSSFDQLGIVFLC